MQLTAENRSQQICSKQMVDHISSEKIGTIAISSPQEYNTTISRDAQISFVLQQFEDDKVQNLEYKEQMITRYGDLATMMQQQEEFEAQKNLEKEQWAMTSTPTRRALIIVQHVLPCSIFFSLPYPRTWVLPQK